MLETTRSQNRRGTAGVLVAALGLAAAHTACTEEPAAIRIKTPRSGPSGSQADLGMPPFTKKGDTMQLKVSAFDDQDRYMGTAPVEWDVTDRTVATISQSGLLTILASGEADVIARTTETKAPVEGRLPIEVVIAERVKIVQPQVPEGERLELPMGEFLQFEAEVVNDRGEPIEDAPIEWTSTTYSASIDPDGRLEGRAIGSTEVTAEYGRATPDRLELFVTDWPPGKRR